MCIRDRNAFLQEAVKLRDSLREFEAGQGDKAAVGVCWSRDAVYVEEIVNKAESEMYESKKQYYKKGCRKVRSFSEDYDLLDTYTTLSSVSYTHLDVYKRQVQTYYYDEYVWKSNQHKHWQVPMYFDILHTEMDISYEMPYLTPMGKVLFQDTDNTMTLTTKTMASRALANDSVAAVDGGDDGD